MTVDRLMINEYGITLEQMMENAGRGLAELARTLLGGSVNERRIAAVCGPGNNGGGGMVAARHLHNWGARVGVTLVSDPERLKETPRHQWRILDKMSLATSGARPEESDLCIDALLGYGGRGDPRPPTSQWIERLNVCGAPILALDVPSGLDATTGRPGKPCIRAAATLTLALPKTGLITSTAREFVGDLFVADIGVPRELYANPELGFGVDVIFSGKSMVQVTT